MPKIKTKKVWGGFFPEFELRRRETGFKCKLGWEGNMKYSLYSSLYPCNSWDPIFSCNMSKENIGVHHGGVFNLEFSPDGSQLVAACEEKAIMIFDPLTRKQICDVPHAHTSCVNGIKFLDNRVFATCSDDKTVALWDVRKLNQKIVRLYGHDNWVKNIEYSSEDGLLVTSGFDGRILGWNINRYAEEDAQCSELFSMEGLMRIKLSPDLTKLVICTTSGYMVVIHNLNLKTLDSDLKDFKPNIYRLMQISNTPFAQAANFTNLFYRKRNQIEFISDFPPGNDADVIHSLQVHPQGWCVLSRNTSTGNSSEWTCVHDIQELEPDKDDLDGDAETSNTKKDDVSNAPEVSHSRQSFYVNSSSQSSDQTQNRSDERSRDLRLAFSIGPRVEVMLRQLPRAEEDDDEEEEESEDRDVVVRSGNFEDNGFDVQLRFTSMDVFEALENIEMRRRLAGRPRGETDAPPGSVNARRIEEDPEDYAPTSPSYSPTSPSYSPISPSYAPTSPPRHFRLRQRRGTEVLTENNRNYRNVFLIRPEIYSHRSILVLPPWNSHGRAGRNVDKDHKIVRNAPRLTNYIEEPNKGKGFIKELCFSSDGRLICSPFDCGVRLMMFDDKCSELSHCVQKEPQQLCTVSNNICHTKCVVSTKFSPVDCLLVSGCLNGKIVWHQPII